MKVIYYIKKIKMIIKKYEVSLISSSTSFYMIVAIFSLMILLLQFYNYFSENSFIINKIIEVVNPYYIKTLESVIPIFSINKFSPFLVINLIWSSSKFINGFNKASDIIYESYKKRNFIINRISSILIFIIILFIIFFELITIFFANKLLKYFINSIYFYMIIQFIIDIFLILSVVIIMNIYIPPVEMNIKKVIKGSFVSTILIYLLLVLYIAIIYIIKSISINLNIITLISLFFLLIYFINFSIVIGFYINYNLQKNTN